MAFCLLSIGDSDSISQNVPASLIKGVPASPQLMTPTHARHSSITYHDITPTTPNQTHFRTCTFQPDALFGDLDVVMPLLTTTENFVAVLTRIVTGLARFSEMQRNKI